MVDRLQRGLKRFTPVRVLSTLFLFSFACVWPCRACGLIAPRFALIPPCADQASADDPQEISMSKGELFDVLDNSGKWWQVAKLDGSGQSGIAPSNYLQLA